MKKRLNSVDQQLHEEIDRWYSGQKNTNPKLRLPTQTDKLINDFVLLNNKLGMQRVYDDVLRNKHRDFLRAVSDLNKFLTSVSQKNGMIRQITLSTSAKGIPPHTIRNENVINHFVSQWTVSYKEDSSHRPKESLSLFIEQNIELVTRIWKATHIQLLLDFIDRFYPVQSREALIESIRRASKKIKTKGAPN